MLRKENMMLGSFNNNDNIIFIKKRKKWIYLNNILNIL